jgi:hypothetical protein
MELHAVPTFDSKANRASEILIASFVPSFRRDLFSQGAFDVTVRDTMK